MCIRDRPEDALRKEIEKQNQHRGVFTPTDYKAHYETITVNGFPCLIVREHPKPSERAILYFFGGGMVIGPDKGELPVTVSYTHLDVYKRQQYNCRPDPRSLWQMQFLQRRH